MKKNLNEILTDGITPTEDLITDEMISAEAAGVDLDRVTSLTLEKAGVKAPKTGFFRRYYKQFSAIAACLVLAVGVFAAYRIWGDNTPAPDSSVNSGETGAKDIVNADGIIWADDERNEGNAGGVMEDWQGSIPTGTEAVDHEPEACPPTEDVQIETDSVTCTDPVDSTMAWESDITVDDEVYAVDWNGIWVNYELYLNLQKAESDNDTVLAIRVENTLSHVPSDYVYNGKSISEWNEEMIPLWEKTDKIIAAYKYGFGLVYGEDIYTVGSTTFGEIWSEDFYFEILAEYGEEFSRLYAEYEAYLTEHDLWGDVEDDIGLYWEKMESVAYDMCSEVDLEIHRITTIINEAHEAYFAENCILFGEGTKFFESAKSVGIPVYAKGTYAFIFATADQLKALANKIDGDGMMFLPASKKEFESQFDSDGNPREDTTADPYDTVEDMVTIFVETFDEHSTDYDTGYDQWETETAFDVTGGVIEPYYPE